MERLTFIYEVLFSVELLHAGYNIFQQNLVAEDIRLAPDNDTSQLFLNHGMNYTFSNGVLTCFMRSRLLLPPAATPVIPFVAFDGNIRTRFLVFSSTDFLNKTQVVAAGTTQVYQFSNQSNAGTNGFIAQHEAGVNGDDLEDAAIVAPDETCFAVIDIHNNAVMNAAYELFGAGGRLLSPAYSIRFIPNP